MVRMRRGAARRALAATSRGRVAVPQTMRQTLRTRFNRVRPLVGKRAGGAPVSGGAVPQVSALRIAGRISRDIVSRVIVAGHAVPGALMDRWAHIDAGELPPDDDTPRPPTPEQAEEVEAEGLAEVQSWGEQRNERVREDVEAEVSRLEAEADELRMTPGPARTAALRRARRLEQQAEDRVEEGRRELERIAEQVREQREEVRAQVRAQVERAEAVVEERVAELRAGLRAEIEAQVSARYFGSDEFDLDEFELS